MAYRWGSALSYRATPEAFALEAAALRYSTKRQESCLTPEWLVLACYREYGMQREEALSIYIDKAPPDSLIFLCRSDGADGAKRVDAEKVACRAKLLLSVQPTLEAFGLQGGPLDNTPRQAPRPENQQSSEEALLS